MSDKNGKETGTDYIVGKNKPPVATRFSSENQPENNGRPKGSIDLAARVRRLLEEPDQLPKPILETIKTVCGEDKRAIDAVMIAGLLQALQGDKGWAEFIVNRGWGKVPEKQEQSGPDGGPIETVTTIKLEFITPTK